MRKRATAAVVAGVLLLSGVAANVAFAHHNSTVTTTTKMRRFTYNDRKDRFVGRLASPRPACLGQRKVKLFKKRTGRRVGVALTNGEGRWSIKARDNSGKYYAVVPKVTLVLASGGGTYGNLWEHLLTCGRVRTDAKRT